MSFKMRLYLFMLLLGLVGGGIIVYYLFPQTVNVPKTEYKDKIITITKEIRTKDGTITKETTRTEDKQGTKDIIIERKNLIGGSALLHGGYEIMYGRKVFKNTWLTVGATTEKDLKAGILIEF